MKLRSYIKRFSPAEREAFAVAVGTTIAHLNNVAYEQRVASAALARQIALHTGREVAEWELRPGDWFRIWPELAVCDGAPPLPEPATAARAAP